MNTILIICTIFLLVIAFSIEAIMERLLGNITIDMAKRLITIGNILIVLVSVIATIVIVIIGIKVIK